jgi:redox-sensitive bicupin YhaK (pirin superfamily)
MNQFRTIREVYEAKAAIEGAGVHLHRGFGYPELPKFDPFLLFDDFSSENPADYLPGFPRHPHRGIETVTYILGGEVRHKDSTGTSGTITKGDVQWMTAGSGIMHEEMPQGERGLKGFQLWVNLPKKHKMMNPRYQEVKSKEIPEISYGKNSVIRVIAGNMQDVKAPVDDIIAEPIYLDIKVNDSEELNLPVFQSHNAFLYVFEGSINVSGKRINEGHVALLNRDGKDLNVKVGSSGSRFLLAAGKPLGEPIAWYGPIVMNTRDELETAVFDLQTNNFVK